MARVFVVRVRPFRFAVTAPVLGNSVPAWQAELRHREDLGFDTIVMADHFTQGYDTEPMVFLTAAAMSTTRLRVQTSVLGNDYRHPVLVHRMAALLDKLSGGRLTLGLGAGWMVSDYEAAGVAYDPPGIRISRLEESVAILKGLFRPEPLRFEGTHYCINGLVGSPPPVQQPHPPFFLGGGSPRVLRFAGREADVVGINASLRVGDLGRHAVLDLSAERTAAKIEWVHEGAKSAGRQPDDIELEMNNWLVRVTATASEAEDFLVRMARRFEVDFDLLAHSPSVLVGTTSQCCDELEARRERFGISYVQLDAGFPPGDVDALGPLVAALAGN
jgi:probable F420-dependent oxidoreductase